MKLYEDGLSHLFGLNPRKRVFKRAIAWTLVTAAVVTPINFEHAMLDYGQRRTTTIVKWYFNPIMKQLNNNFAKQMEKAQQRQKIKQLPHQVLKSGH